MQHNCSSIFLYLPALPNFTFLSSLSSLAVTGLGAPLSYYSEALEEALYKSPEWTNEWLKINCLHLIKSVLEWQMPWKGSVFFWLIWCSTAHLPYEQHINRISTTTYILLNLPTITDAGAILCFISFVFIFHYLPCTQIMWLLQLLSIQPHLQVFILFSDGHCIVFYTFVLSPNLTTIIHSFILAISIAPLQVHYYSEVLPTIQHGHCMGVSRRSA